MVVVKIFFKSWSAKFISDKVKNVKLEDLILPFHRCSIVSNTDLPLCFELNTDENLSFGIRSKIAENI